MSSDNDQPPPETAIIPAAPGSPCSENPLSPITPLPVPPTPYSVSLRQDVSAIFKRLKKWSWRLTGLYVTAVLVGLLFGFAQDVIALPRLTAWRIADFLGLLGFSPTDRTYLTPVARILWILLITGFRFWQVIGLLFYCLFFWLILGFYLVTRFTKKKTPKSAAATQPKERASRWRRLQALWRVRIRAILTCFLMAWFLLYGSTTDRRVLGLAVVAAFLLLISVIWSALRRTRIPKEDPILLQLLVQFGHSWFEHARGVAPPTSREAATKALETETNNAKILISTLQSLRRLRLDGLVWGLSLIEYLFWPMILVAVAIANWTLAYRFTLAPAPVDWETAVLVAASPFLPGVNIPSGAPSPPAWVTLGSGFTAAFVWVLYVALLSALLTKRQTRLSGALSKTKERLRWYSVRVGRTVRWLRLCRERFP